MGTEPRKLSELLDICLHTKTPGGLQYGMCTVAAELEYRKIISHDEMWLVKDECMALVRETRLRGHRAVCLLRSALLHRLSGKHMDVDDLCYLIYTCWIDKLESEGK